MKKILTKAKIEASLMLRILKATNDNEKENNEKNVNHIPAYNLVKQYEGTKIIK